LQTYMPTNQGGPKKEKKKTVGGKDFAETVKMGV